MAAGTGATERKARELEEELWDRAQAEWPSVARAHRWEFQVLRWCMADPALRTQILRFMDCLPALTDPRDVVRHLREYFAGESSRPPAGRAHLPAPLRLGLAAARPALFTAPAVAAATRHTAAAIARLFIAGATLEEAAGPIRRMQGEGFRVTVDLLGEQTVSQQEADRYAARYVELTRAWRKTLRSAPHVSLKLSSLAFPFDPLDPEGAQRQISPRFGRIFQAALAERGLVNVDMEQRHLRDLTLTLVRRLLEEDPSREPAVGVVIQAYLKDAEETTRRLLDWARRKRRGITIRLVRGAYWDTEVIWSRQRNWPVPVYTRKEETDACYDRLAGLLLENHDCVKVAIGTHNAHSLARAIVQARRLGIPGDRWECQMLYGMSEPLQRAVLQAEAPLRIYTPVGELIPGMAYLVRRILENTSQHSFLAAGLRAGIATPRGRAGRNCEPRKARGGDVAGGVLRRRRTTPRGEASPPSPPGCGASPPSPASLLLGVSQWIRLRRRSWYPVGWRSQRGSRGVAMPALKHAE